MTQIHEDEIMGKAYDGRLMKRLMRYALPYKKTMLLSVILLLSGQFCHAIRPQIIQGAIDNAIIVGDMAKLNEYTAIFIGLLIAEFVFQYAVFYITQYIGQNIIYDIRVRLFAHLQKFELSFFDRNPVGRLITRVTSDIEVLNDMFSSGLVYIFGDIFLIIGIIFFMFHMNVSLALITLSVLPFLFYASLIFRKNVRQNYRDIRLKVAETNSFFQENITGISVIQLFNREKKRADKFDQINRELTGHHIKSVFYYGLFYPTVGFISSMAIAMIIWYGGDVILTSVGADPLSTHVTAGTLFAFIMFAQLFFRPIQDLSDKYNILQTAMASSERVFKLLDRKPPITNPENPVKLNALNGDIEFRNVFFAYNAKDRKEDWDYVLKDISFEVRTGESIALVGATGAGKSSVINILSRFYEIQQGQILLDGVDIRQLNQYELRKHIAVVLQNVFLFSGNILENIRLWDQSIPEEKAIRAAQTVGADRFIERLPGKYYEEVKEGGSTLSVGQRQLISFARALAFDPKILVLDEATSSIDTETEILIQAAIKKLMAGRTSFIIAHRLSTIKNVDRIIVLHKGRIRETGNHDELIAQGGIYYKLYQLQYKYQEAMESTVPLKGRTL